MRVLGIVGGVLMNINLVNFYDCYFFLEIGWNGWVELCWINWIGKWIVVGWIGVFNSKDIVLVFIFLKFCVMVVNEGYVRLVVWILLKLIIESCC